MTESLTQGVPRKIVLVLAGAAAAWLCYSGAVHALASHYGTSSNPNDWQRASKIEPANAENWYRQGRYRQLDFDHSDLPLAISYYQRAVQLDPRSPFYKLDLASALEMNGNDAEAERYFRAAQDVYPISAEVSWRYGNFLLRQQRLPEAYAEIHRALTVDPKLLSLAASRAWHSDPDVRVLLDQVLPKTPQADWEALAFLVQAQEVTAALTVWNDLIEQKPSIDWKNVFAFTDLLVNQDRFEDAGSVWRQSISAEAASLPAPLDGSLIFDGGFETEIPNGGFGWRQQDVPGADFEFDAEEKHSGTRSARIAFDGAQNLNYANLYQLVLVRPRTRYRFRAYLSADHISTDSGARFEILDSRQAKDLDVFTPNVTGTQPWTLQEVEFTTGPQTHLVQIILRRIPSQHFDNAISGTVWVDDVSLLPVGAAP